MGIESFTKNYSEARKFRLQRQTDLQRQAIQQRQLEIQEAELTTKLAKQKEEREIRSQIKVLANEYNRILATPTPGVWDLKNHTITDKAAQELIRISAQIAALDPQIGSTYGRYVDMIYNQPTPTPIEPKPNAVVEKFEGLKAIGYNDEDARRLAGGEREAGDPEEKMIRDLTTDFLKDEKALTMAKSQAESKGQTFDPASYAAKKASQALQAITQGKATLESIRSGQKARKMGSSGIGELRESERNLPAPIAPIGGPQDTVEVDINDPRLLDDTSDINERAIDVNAPATEDTAPIDETDVLDKINKLKAGKQPFSSYRLGRNYFLQAVANNFLEKPAYDVVHNKYLKPAYPDTLK